MVKKMMFVYNPYSGKGTIRSHLAGIIDTFAAAGYEITIHPTQYPKDAMETAEALDSEYEILVCSGGDGTLDEVVNGMKRAGKQYPIGYIPAGSTNDFATSLGIPKDMEKAAKQIVDGEIFPCDIGQFDDKYFVYVAAFGAFTATSYATSQDLKNALGHMAYLLEGMKGLVDIQPYHIRITYEDEHTRQESVFENDVLLGMISNTNSIGGFKNLTGKNVELDDGLFEVTMVVNPKNVIEMQMMLTALLTNSKSELVFRIKTPKLHVSLDVAVPWTLDGEYGGDYQEVDVINRKEAMDIMIATTDKGTAIESPTVLENF